VNVLIYAYKNTIILTFKHENSLWLVLKCIHDLQEKKHTKQKKQKTTKLKEKKNTQKEIFMKLE
jgi:hypothetical protein